MSGMMHKNASVMSHQFSMVPKADIPRSSFDRPHGIKTTFDAGYLVPFFCDEVLPGDSFNLSATMFARMATPIFPIMDNLYLDTFYFFVPNRLLWNNWQKFMGQQDNPGDSISYLVPQQVAPSGGYLTNSLQDYMGLPTLVQGYSHCAFWPRAYNLIWNEWFRDENLQNSVVVDKGDGPDTVTNYTLLRRGKRHDYFTSCLPWAQKGTAVTLPLGNAAEIKLKNQNGMTQTVKQASNLGLSGGQTLTSKNTTAELINAAQNNNLLLDLNFTHYADLSTATSATINAIRLAFQVQRLQERDARGGTRYTEIIRAHFGVISPDARLQRPEYLGGGSTPIMVNPIAQTSGTGASGTTAPVGTLAGMGVATGHNGFTKSFVEHGVILGLMSIRADLNYQQGLARMWSRSTRYDFYFPAFSHLGEQAVLNKEIYTQGSAAPTVDAAAFGYQEAWAEYRYKNSMITGRFRSQSPSPLDAWHLAQKFNSLPVLNTSFIQDTPPVDRVVAVGAGALGSQFLLDGFIKLRCARPMPMYSVPGLIDHF